MTSSGTSSKPNSESKVSSPSYKDLELAGTLREQFEKYTWKFTWIIRKQPKRKSAYGIASEAFPRQQTSCRLCLYSFGFPKKVSRCFRPNKEYAFGPRAAIVLVPDRGFYNGEVSFHWILDVKLTSGDLLKRFRSRRYRTGDTLRDEYFVLSPRLSGRIHSPSGETLSVVCELTLERSEGVNPWLEPSNRILELETPSSEEQEQESLLGYHHLEWVRSAPLRKYSWTIRDWPTRKGVLSERMWFFDRTHMCLHSTDFSAEDELGNTSRLPRLVLIRIVQRSVDDGCTRKGLRWKLDVKRIDGTPLHSFPGRPLVFREDGIPRTEFFVLPAELAQQIHSGNRFSVVCELELEKIDDGHDSVPSSVEAATQAPLTSGLDGHDVVAPSVEAATQTQLTSGLDGLSRDLEQLLLRGAAQEDDTTDATVRVRGRGFPVHRAILSARTPVFSSMFRHPMSERETGVVDVEDCEPETFRRFLQYAYAGRVEDLAPENARALYKLADKYLVEGLKGECLVFLKEGLSVRTVCETVALAARHGETDLLGLASDFFAKNAKDVVQTVEWQNFMVQDPTRANELLVKAFQKAPFF